MHATKRESAPGPDGLPYSAYRCAGGIGGQILCDAYGKLLGDGGLPLLFFAFSRDVFTPKTAPGDDQGWIVLYLCQEWVVLPLLFCFGSNSFTVAAYLKDSPIQEGPQLNGEGCDER